MNQSKNASVSILKPSRKEAKSSNLSRLNGGESEDKSAKDNTKKQDLRLAPIQSLLALLPEPFDAELETFASTLLSRAIQVIHYTRRLEFHEKNPSFIPSSIRFKHKLTCKVEYEDNDIFITQRTLTNKILRNTTEKLCECMVKVMIMEKEGAINKLQEEFINGLTALFVCYTNYYKFAFPDATPPYSNEEGAEVLLHKYFSIADDKIYKYLMSNKIDFLIKHRFNLHADLNS